MKNLFSTPRFVFVTTAILVSALSRLFPHIPNFTPIAAMALFGGVYYSDKRFAIIIPLIAMLLSDIGLQFITGYGFHNTMIYVYISFILTTFIGFIVKRNTNILSVSLASLISSVLFFAITNFGHWAANMSGTGISGLTSSYIAGIPFFTPTAIGDLFFSGVLFGAFYFAQIKFPVLQKV